MVGSSSEAARCLGISEWAARSCRKLTASSILVLQSMLLTVCVPPNTAPRTQVASMITMSFDETTERICMPLDADLTDSTVSDQWHVLVSTVDVNIC